jgi:hypothetical protein
MRAVGSLRSHDLIRLIKGSALASHLTAALPPPGSFLHPFILQFVEDFSHIPSLPVDGHEQTGRGTHPGGKVDAAGPETRDGVHVGSRLWRPPSSAPASREKCPVASVRIVPLRSRRLGS